MPEAAPPTPIDVLANDTDIDAGFRAIESVTQGANGTVAIVNEGEKLTYRPERGYCGSDSFTYTANGGSSATVSVAVPCLEQTTGIVELSTSPGLVPLSFDRTVDDYVLRCNNNKPVDVTAFVAPGYTIKVAGQATLTGSVQTTVPLKEDLEFIVTVSRGDGQHRYHVRCLPSDFPAWEYVRFDPPRHRFYVVAPTLGVSAANLVIIFDDNGVPVWWYEASETPFDAKVFPRRHDRLDPGHGPAGLGRDPRPRRRPDPLLPRRAPGRHGLARLAGAPQRRLPRPLLSDPRPRRPDSLRRRRRR